MILFLTKTLRPKIAKLNWIFFLLAFCLCQNLFGEKISPWKSVEVENNVEGSMAIEQALRHREGAVLGVGVKTGDVIKIEPTALPGAKGLDFSICYADKRPSQLELNVFNAKNEVIALFNLFPDGLGWRRVLVVFSEDALKLGPAGNKEPSRLELRVLDSSPVTIYLGKPSWSKSLPFRRTADTHCPSIYSLRTDSYARATRDWLNAFTNKILYNEIAFSPELEIPAKNYDCWVLGNEGGKTALKESLLSTQQLWSKNAIKSLEDLGLHSEKNWIQPTEVKLRTIGDLTALLTPLAIEWRRAQDQRLLEKILTLFDYLEQEGIANSTEPFGENTLQFARLKIGAYAHAVALLREPLQKTGRLERIRKILRLYSRVGEWDGDTALEVNSDVLRGEAEIRFIYAMLAPNPGNRAYEYTRLQVWLNKALSISSNQVG